MWLCLPRLLIWNCVTLLSVLIIPVLPLTWWTKPFRVRYTALSSLQFADIVWRWGCLWPCIWALSIQAPQPVALASIILMTGSGVSCSTPSQDVSSWCPPPQFFLQNRWHWNFSGKIQWCWLSELKDISHHYIQVPPCPWNQKHCCS